MAMLSKIRSSRGSIAAEHAAALIVLFLCIFFPLCNIAAMCYRYGFLVQASHNGAHAGATATTFSAGSSSAAVMDVVPATVNNFLNQLKGVSNRDLDVRLLQTRVSDKVVTRHPDGTKLNAALPAGNLLSIECTVTADLDPLVSFKGSMVPAVPGMTQPIRASVTSRELLENPSRMNE